MTTTVYGDLTADGGRIVLLAGGPVDEVTFLAKQLQQLTPLIKPTDPSGGLVLPATWPAVVQLAAVYGDAWAPQPRLREWITGQTAVRIQTTDHGPLTVPVPDGLVPRPYQVDGARLIAATGHALITDEPRTGKTITTILGLAEAALRGRTVTPLLVVAPNVQVCDAWLDALHAWAPYWTSVAWRGAPARRKGLIGSADVYVTTYATAAVDAKDTNPSKSPLIALDPRGLVADECHLIKNPHAARTSAVRRLSRNVRAFVALSGTPITHHPGDLWPTLTCLAPGAWPSRERWVNRYCLTGVADYGESILGLNPGNESEFRLTVLGQARRVARADVLDQLPPKVYSVRTVELPPEYRKAYDSMESDMLAQLPDGGELPVMSVLAQLTRLSQLSSAAADVTITYEVDAEGVEREHVAVQLTNPSWKVDELLEILAERAGDPTVCFAVSAQLTRLAGQAAAAAGLRVGNLIGKQNARERREAIAAFQAGELDVLCATTAAGGVGITLSAAGTVVFLQRPWSLVDSLQAEDRAEGDPNQTRGTEVIDIVAANTIDTRVRAVLREKAGQLSALVQDPRIVAELLGGATVTRIRNRKAS